MKKLYHFLGCLFFLVWTIIGLVIILGGVALVITIKNADFSAFTPQSMLGGMIDRSAGQGVGPTTQQIDCARKILGGARIKELQQGNQPPTQEEMDKLKPCFPEGITGEQK
ncbi:hypothetical protein HZB03_01775 [Candidatus Woesearchaeota archaeon]|nr:hypothetical protein [Candidatus Woesearchaeota archaeon]